MEHGGHAVCLAEYTAHCHAARSAIASVPLPKPTPAVDRLRGDPVPRLHCLMKDERCRAVPSSCACSRSADELRHMVLTRRRVPVRDPQPLIQRRQPPTRVAGAFSPAGLDVLCPTRLPGAAPVTAPSVSRSPVPYLLQRGVWCSPPCRRRHWPPCRNAGGDGHRDRRHAVAGRTVPASTAGSEEQAALPVTVRGHVHCQLRRWRRIRAQRELRRLSLRRYSR